MAELTINKEVNDVVFTTLFTDEDVEMSIDRQMDIFKEEFGFTDEENDPVRDMIRDFAHSINPEKECMLVVKRDGRLIGSVSFVGEDNGVGRLRYVYLEPDERNKGIGKYMINLIVDMAREHGYKHLWLSTYNILHRHGIHFPLFQFQQGIRHLSQGHDLGIRNLLCSQFFLNRRFLHCNLLTGKICQ